MAKSFKELEGQLAHWLEQLWQYTFDVVYRRTGSHGSADMLSHYPYLQDAPLDRTNELITLQCYQRDLPPFYLIIFHKTLENCN